MGNGEEELMSLKITLSRSEAEKTEDRISYRRGRIFFNDIEVMLVA